MPALCHTDPSEMIPAQIYNISDYKEMINIVLNIFMNSHLSYAHC